MHWKMLSSTPGLHPVEANSRRQPTSSKYPNIGENEKCVFYFYGENETDFLANPIYVNFTVKELYLGKFLRAEPMGQRL